MSKKFVRLLEFSGEEVATVEEGINVALAALQDDRAVRVDYIHAKRILTEYTVHDYVTITYRLVDPQ
jgi:hypothetical protein